MKTTIHSLALLTGFLLLTATLLAKAAPAPLPPKPQPVTPAVELLFHAVRCDGKLTDTEARFAIEIDAESIGKGEGSAALFEGDIAVPAPKLPPNLRLVRDGKQYRLVATKPGKYKFKLELIAKITKAEPWNQVSFVGPVASIASVTAEATGTDAEVELLSGTPTDAGDKKSARVSGFLGADRSITLRWQSKTIEVARKALVNCETAATAQINPTVIRLTTQFRYEILQGKLARLTATLPANHALTRVEGDQIRDWQVKPDADRQLLTVEFLKPLEAAYALTLHTEQTLDSMPFTGALDLPQPLEVERETGTLTLTALDTVVETDAATGLRQINAPDGALAAYRFYGRPVTLSLKLRRIEPVITANTRVTARLEESRLTVAHALTLNIEKAGVYALELAPLTGFVVTDVRGEGVEDWKAKDDKLTVTFNARVLGARRLDIQLEQAQKTFPESIAIAPLRVTGATKHTFQIGAAAAAGIRLKTADLTNLREIPITSLAERSDELLAFVADAADWSLKLAAERLTPRVIAEIFNLVTIGDGLVGGSATIRYAIFNQGVQEFRLSIPANWKNVDFTGPSIRRKDQQGDTWTIGLQDKAWGGYTLVITYDEQFDPHRATLALGGVHALGVERETGAIALTSAANLQLREQTTTGPLRRIDENELAETDRALITRSVLLAYRCASGDPYQLSVEVTRFQDVQPLEAVADRTQLTTVLTESGQMLTQATYMLKNNDKPYQKFTLPKGAEFWSCYVTGQAVKPEKQGDDVLVPLPRGVNRDQAFPVEIVYAQKIGDLKSKWPRDLALQAPQTDIQTTYAEWELYVPQTHDLARFGGTMSVARGTTYGLRDASNEFVGAYRRLFSEGLPVLILILVGGLLLALIISALRKGARGLVAALGVVAVLVILAGMMLPALSKAKAKAQRISTINKLKQVGLAARIYGTDNGDLFPSSFEQMKNELSTDKVLYDAETGERFVYAGAGLNDSIPDALLAYSPSDHDGHRAVVLTDGSVQVVTTTKFNELLLHTADAKVAAEAARKRASQLAATGTPPPAAPSAQSAERLPESRADTPAIVNAPVQLGIEGAQQPGLFAQAGVGGGGGAGGVPVMGAAFVPPAKAPTIAGLRSIRIDVPRIGHRFQFTKILNVAGTKEPLKISALAVDTKVRNVARSCAQIVVFAVGLVLAWTQVRRAKPNSLLATLGVALALGSVISMLVVTRFLGWVLIGGAPFVALVPLVLLLLHFWRNRKAAEAEAGESESPASEGGVSPVTPLIALCFFTLTANAAVTPIADVGPTGISNLKSQISNSPPAAAPTPAPTSAIGDWRSAITSADYTGTVHGKVARIEVAIQITTSKPNQTVELFCDDIAVKSFTAQPADAKLLRTNKSISVRLAKKGDATIRLKFLVKVGGDAASMARQIAFAIPPALSSKFTLTLDEPEASVEFPTAVAFHSTTAGSETRVEAVLGAGERVELRWTPRVKRAHEIAATVFTQNAILVSFRGGVINTRSLLDYQVTQGELRELRVRLPAGQRLLRVEGEQIRTWQIKATPVTGAADETILTVELVKGISPTYRLTLETEKALDQLPSSFAIDTPHALEVKRETGWVALSTSEELGLIVETAVGAEQVDAAEFLKVVPQAGALAGAYQFLKPDFALRVRVSPLQPQIEVVARQHTRIGTEQITLRAQLDYTIKRAGVFALRVAFPPEFRVESVTGNDLAQWVEKTESDARVLEVTLKKRTLGAYALQLALVKSHKELPKSVTILGVHPLDTQKLTGFVTVSTEVGVQAKTETFDGLTEVPATTVVSGQPLLSGSSGAGTGGLAYRFIATEPVPSTQPWKLALTTEKIDAWVRAEVVNWLTLTETLLSGRALVRYDIQNAPVKEFRLRVPTEFKNVEIIAPNIRRRDETNGEWRVELQNRVVGVHTLTVTWELPVSVTEDAKDLAIAGVEVLGVERETGALAVIAKPPLQVTPKSASDELVRIDASELPDWAQVRGAGSPLSPPRGEGDRTSGEGSPTLAWRYLRPGYKLTLTTQQHKQAEVLQALVDSLRLSTVVAEDGQMMTEATFSVRNNGRQFLEVALPAGAQVWSAFVAGQAVRPTLREGKLLLPLERTGSDEGAISVELTYVSAQKFPATRGNVEMISPALDVPVKEAQWELYLPVDFNYQKFAGTMARIEAEAAPVAVAFSATDYEKGEVQRRKERRLESSSFLSRARSNVAAGKLKEAARYYKGAKSTRDLAEKDESVVQLGEELKKAQSSNLILGQRLAFENNADMFRQGVDQPVQQQSVAAYDMKAAEQQVEKLQRAQEVAIAKVRPLRVHLPTTGLRHSFAQILQTEIGKPMSIRFLAANAKAPSWTGRIAGVVLGFVVLWAVVALALKRRTESAT